MSRAGETSSEYEIGKKYISNDELSKRRIEREKFYKESENDFAAVVAKKCKQIIVNDVVYDSYSEAARCTGMSVETVRRYANILNKSGLSEKEFDIKIQKTFIFKKVK